MEQTPVIPGTYLIGPDSEMVIARPDSRSNRWFSPRSKSGTKPEKMAELIKAHGWGVVQVDPARDIAIGKKLYSVPHLLVSIGSADTLYRVLPDGSAAITPRPEEYVATTMTK